MLTYVALRHFDSIFLSAELMDVFIDFFFLIKKNEDTVNNHLC